MMLYTKDPFFVNALAKTGLLEDLHLQREAIWFSEVLTVWFGDRNRDPCSH